MSKFKELKDYVKGHIPQIVGTVAGIIAVILVCVIIIILNSEVKNDNGQIETTKKQALETTIKNEETKETVTKQTKATTKTDGTTTEETSKEEDTTEQATKKQEETKRQQEAATNVQVVTTQQHTTVQPTTKKQEQTTKKQETTTAPVVRGKNGVILEELARPVWGGYDVMPKTKTELIKQCEGYEGSIGYAYLYTDIYENDKKPFNNELTFQKTTESQVISIYGQPLTSHYSKNGKDKYIVYQYGYYANGVRDEIIYITFGFANVLDMKLGSVEIASTEYTKLKEN